MISIPKVRAAVLAGVVASILLTGCQTAGTQGTRDPRLAEASNMQLVGHSDLQARSAYMPVIHEHAGRWVAYIGHHGGPATVNPLTRAAEFNGTSFVDVTDPKNPKYLHHIPGEEGPSEGGGAQMVRVCDGKTLPKGDRLVYMLRTFGNSAQEVWDVTNPDRPTLLSTIVKGLKGTHKNWWECDTGIAYLVSGHPDWRSRRITQVWDLSDPAKPVHIRDFGLVGQQPGASGAVPTALHGPISMGPKGNRIYFGYGTNADGVLQIVDREKLLKGPKALNPENLLYPQVSRLDLPAFMGAHTSLPWLDIDVTQFAKDEKGKKRDFVVIVNESLRNECTEEGRQLVYVVDVTDETRPFPVANYDVSEESGNFCSRGGRFGAHASNENFPPMYAKRIVFISWFNAGVRAVDMRNPYNPREIAFYIAATTDKTAQRCVKTPEGARCKIAIQTNNVEVDDRGYIYIVDRANTGLHILELTGAARSVANFR